MHLTLSFITHRESLPFMEYIAQTFFDLDKYSARSDLLNFEILPRNPAIFICGRANYVRGLVGSYEVNYGTQHCNSYIISVVERLFSAIKCLNGALSMVAYNNTRNIAEGILLLHYKCCTRKTTA